MDYGIVLKVIGILLIIEVIFLLPSLLISLYFNESASIAFLITILIGIVIGLILYKRENKKIKISIKEGLTIVTIGWLSVSLLGAIPLYITNSTNTYVEAFFEVVSGFTTTGASLISDVESLSKGILFWRSLTQWLGAMGIIVFTVALLPSLGIGGFQIFRAESPGPVPGKIAPRIKDTAKILYRVYFLMTILQIILLYFGGMNLLDSFLNAFGTVATGGFKIKNNANNFDINIYVYLNIVVFMIISGINFSLYHSLYNEKLKDMICDEELKFYLGLIILSTFLISLNLFMNKYGSFKLSLRDSFFQSSSIITTTGYSIVDFDTWPSFSKAILYVLMVIGGSSGSTAGGIKVIRVLIILKLIKREVIKTFHPRAILPIKVNGKIISDETISGIYSYLGLYILIVFVGILLVSLEGVNLGEATNVIISVLSNVGEVNGFIGPSKGFNVYSQPILILLSFFMLLGRLELFTIIALLVPRNWKREI